jgi:hypothetical protein
VEERRFLGNVQPALALKDGRKTDDDDDDDDDVLFDPVLL